MTRSLKRQEPPDSDPYRAQPLPLDRMIAVYYRQSSEGQIYHAPNGGYGRPSGTFGVA